MSVRAKFKVYAIEASSYGEDGRILKTVKMRPVYADKSPENKEFYKWSPCGELSLGVLNEAASEQFHLGKEYYLDFTPAE